MRVRLEKNGAMLLLDGPPIARGGEAAIYAVPDYPALLGKVYHEPTSEQADKLTAMIANPPADPTSKQGHTSIAWPTDRLLADDAERCVGFVMPRVEKVQSLFDVYNPKSRLQTWPLFHYGYLVRTARNLAIAVRALHTRGYVLGDLNESNVLVTSQTLVTIVDTDSFQTRTPDRVFRCMVGKPEYIAPEIQNASFADMDRSPEHDYFALAVLIFQLLMQGTHPFMGRFSGEGEAEVLAKRIAAGHWPYARLRRGPYEPNTTAPPFAVLPTPLRELMRLCFEDGHERPSMRPDAGRWQKALAEADAELVECLVNAQHRFHKDLNGCPWCELMLKQGRDPFPSKEALQARLNGAAAAKNITMVATATVTKPAAAPPPTPPALPAPETATAVKPSRPRPASRKPLPPVLAVALTPWPWMIAAGASALVVLVYMVASNAHRPVLPPIPTLAGTNVEQKRDGDDPQGSASKGLDDAKPEKGDTPGRSDGDKPPEDKSKPPDDVPAPPPEIVPPIGPATNLNGQIWCFDGHKDAVNCMAFSPDGKRILTGCEDGLVYLWDVEKGVKTICDGEHIGAVRCVAFSPDGAWAASGGGDNVARIWNVRDGSMVRACEGHSSEIVALAFTNGGRNLLTGAVAGDPNPNMANGPSDGMIRSWASQPGAGKQSKASARIPGPPNDVTCMAFTANARYILMAGPSAITGDAASSLFTWDCRAGRAIRVFQADDLGAIYSIALSASGAQAVSTGENGDVRLWDMNTGKVVLRLAARAGAVWCAAFSPAGDRLLTGSDDGTVRLWEVATGKELQSFSGHTGVVRGVAFSADGQRGVSGGDDKTARVWDLSK